MNSHFFIKITVGRLVKKLIKSASILLIAVSLASDGVASTFFFPGAKPAYISGDAPKWLHEGHGRDGYLTITSEVIPTSSCVPLSNHNFWGGEKTQLVLSIATNGFKSKLDNNEIPIAAFDGRDNGSECASLSTLPINVVPLALLESFSTFNPGELSLVLNVKSSSDSNQDFIGSAKLLLGAAAMVVSGGTATAISGIAATVGNPVLSEAQTRTNTLMQGMVNAKTQLSLTWPKLRNGIRTIEIPVYRAESSLGSTAEKRIQQLQTEDKTEKTVLFTVRLSFNYASSLFDPASSGTGELPNIDNIAAANVLNYQMTSSQYNFLQILNDTSPSLLQTVAIAQGHDLTHACSIGLGKLKRIGLSNIDIAIIMKSFIDEAKGSGNWYGNPVIVQSCFGQMPGVQNTLEKIYGASSPKFVIGDVQDGIGQPYRSWREMIGPALSNFRKALIAKENRLNTLIDFNSRRDIKVSFSPEVQAWQGSVNSNSSGKELYPGIEKLANKDIKTIACFIYKENENLSVKNPGAYFILEDTTDNFWLSGVKLFSDGSGKISSVELSELTSDWKSHFESYSYPGGDCAGTLARLNGRTSANLGHATSSNDTQHGQ